MFILYETNSFSNNVPLSNKSLSNIANIPIIFVSPAQFEITFRLCLIYSLCASCLAFHKQQDIIDR